MAMSGSALRAVRSRPEDREWRQFSCEPCGSRPPSQRWSHSLPRASMASPPSGWPRALPRGWCHRYSSPIAGDGSGRLFILEQEGRIRILAGGTLRQLPFLNLTDRVLAGGERGLLGLAFHPQFRSNRRLFVNYTRRPDGATVVVGIPCLRQSERGPYGRAEAAHRAATLRQPQWRHARLWSGRPSLHRPGRRRLRRRSAKPRAEPATSCSARSSASTSIEASPTRSRPTTRSRTAAAGPRSSPGAFATPGASRSIGAPASSM